MAELARARAYFAVGAPFEQVWLPRIAAANPEMRVVHTEQGIQKIAMAAHHHDAAALK
jgi:zinc transport system substrate-binding protein